jgi:nucleoid DNA-binding protein
MADRRPPASAGACYQRDPAAIPVEKAARGGKFAVFWLWKLKNPAKVITNHGKSRPESSIFLETTMAKKTNSKLKKISPASKPRTKGEFYSTIAEATELSRKQVASVFDAMGQVLAADLGKGPKVCNIAGLMKVTVVHKPATKARKGINPFTKQETMFKAKPARNVVKVRPLKALKALV